MTDYDGKERPEHYELPDGDERTELPAQHMGPARQMGGQGIPTLSRILPGRKACRLQQG